MTMQPKSICADAMLAVTEETMHNVKTRCQVVLDEADQCPLGILEIFDR